MKTSQARCSFQCSVVGVKELGIQVMQTFIKVFELPAVLHDTTHYVHFTAHTPHNVVSLIQLDYIIFYVR